MNKLSLDVEELRVDSFETNERAGDDRGFAWSDDSVCPTTAPSDRRPCY
ncbi:MAG TPA: hypothetical protein VF092_24570 [Longimicrobium sp.]